MTDREILDSVISSDCAKEKKEKDKESEVNDVHPEKPKLSEIAGATKLLECLSLFDKSESKPDSHLVLYRRGLTNSFSKNSNIVSFLQRKILKQHLTPKPYFLLIA